MFCFLLCRFGLFSLLWFCSAGGLLLFLAVVFCVVVCIVGFVFFVFASCFVLLGCCVGFFVDMPALLLSVLLACCCFCVLVLDCADLLSGEKDGKSDDG